jgi:hypothetical protein
MRCIEKANILDGRFGKVEATCIGADNIDSGELGSIHLLVPNGAFDERDVRQFGIAKINISAIALKKFDILELGPIKVGTRQIHRMKPHICQLGVAEIRRCIVTFDEFDIRYRHAGKILMDTSGYDLV